MGQIYRDVIVAIRDCFLREECWSTDDKDEEKLMKDKIRACVVQSTMDSKHNEGEYLRYSIFIS